MSEVIHRDSIERWAHEQVTGADVSLTCELVQDFVQNMSASREPVKTHVWSWAGPISDYELIAIMSNRRHGDDLIAAATREFFTRYLDSDVTKAAIQRLCLEIGK
jgi:hypothetical protein